MHLLNAVTLDLTVLHDEVLNILLAGRDTVSGEQIYSYDEALIAVPDSDYVDVRGLPPVHAS